MIPPIDLSALQSESRNKNSTNIDKVTTLELCEIINHEDSQIAGVVQKCLPTVAAAIDALEGRVRQGGKIVYVGAGTSGRLGVLDASELPPTFSANPEQFVAIIAGGDDALRHAQEGAEDDVGQAVRDLQSLRLDGRRDALIGIAASGRTPYVLSCLEYAKSLGCVTVGVACSSPSAMSASGVVDHMIEAVTGGEVVTGSTRMRAGTATKLVLNMLSTGVMIKTGKTFGNMMVDLKATNLKLQQRARNILRELCGPVCPKENDELDELLQACDGSVKLAIATLKLQISVPQAKQVLDNAGGVLAVALASTFTSVNGFLSREEVNKRAPLVLCVDGGGTKCAAVVLTSTGEMLIGDGGGCNATEIGPQAARDTIVRATERALANFDGTKSLSLCDVNFSKIWIGLAGYDRPAIVKEISHLLEETFGRKLGATFKASNDLELVATVAAEQAGVDTAVVLIAGTGSVAMSYSRSTAGFNRIRRAGGYGHLLGDEGSAFDIGRQGIKHALEEIDQASEGGSIKTSAEQVGTLTKMIVEDFGVELSNSTDLLSAIMSPGNSPSLSKEAKWRITSAARTVLDAADVCEVAADIVRKAAVALAAIASKAVTSPQIDSLKSVLVLTGGLMRNQAFRNLVSAEISKCGHEFRKIEWIGQPAVTGALHMRTWEEISQ